MIIYDFSCPADHRFEGWFGSAEDCERQLSRGLVRCPHCDSGDVARVPSAAHVHTGSSAPQPSRVPAPPSDPAVAQQAQVLQRLREWVSRAEDVGTGFADEARRIHQQEAPERAIRGVTTHEEAQALRDEGIPVLAVPPHLVDKTH